MLRIRPTPYDHPDAVRLIAEVQRFYVERYGGEDVTPVDPGEFTAPGGRFLLGYVEVDAGAEAVACGGWRVRDGASDPALRDGDAELKRMYVAPSHRGRGHARAVLAALEASAAVAGRSRLVLETGTLQPEAIALYTSSGYEPMPPFGAYRASSTSRCYARVLRTEAPPEVQESRLPAR